MVAAYQSVARTGAQKTQRKRVKIVSSEGEVRSGAPESHHAVADVDHLALGSLDPTGA